MIENLKAGLTRLATAAALMLVAGLLSLGALSWFSAALYLALKRDFDPPIAALLTGLAVVAAAGVLAAIARFSTRRRTRREPNSAASSENTPAVADLAASLGQASAQVIGSHGKSAALGAFAAGFIIGAKPGLRRTLAGQLSNIFH